MPLVTRPYNFTNGTTADANQVDQNENTLYNLVNGNLDSANIKAAGIATSNIATEAVTPSKSEGLPYAVDLFGSSGFIYSGLGVTKDGTNANQADVAAGVAYVKQPDGSLRRLTPAATNFKTTSPSSTYYLDLNPDGTWTWGGHSLEAGYLNICTVTSDGSSNVSTVTMNTTSQTVTLMSGSNATVQVNGFQSYNPLTNPYGRLHR